MKNVNLNLNKPRSGRNGLQKVVSIRCFPFLFVRFCTVKYVPTYKAFSLWCHGFRKKVPMEKETSCSVGGTNTFIALFQHIYLKAYTLLFSFIFLYKTTLLSHLVVRQSPHLTENNIVETTQNNYNRLVKF